MLTTLRRLFDQSIAPALSDESGRERALHLATTALLIEVCRADNDISDIELDTVAETVMSTFALDRNETAELISSARAESDASVDLFQFTRLVDARLSPAEKVHVIELLWRVAFADGRLDRYEEYVIRKLADLLHVAHRDFISAKLAAHRYATTRGPT